ncbi:vanadium-dependent haloperoxidase [Aestuariivivens sediminis]|uniref:vanadium-dependent haloperoxidase n=1 Tax=Aestuariivivens sediminis TaxID=2913557 RepID=UPI001F5958CA|nr:vanadium-dependent haloperoxidase [Aestuariivivens sediminis]
MKRNTFFTGVMITIFFMVSCSKPNEHIDITTDDFHNVLDELIDIMVHDIFSPPVASRVFAYPDITAYEIIAHNNPNYNSLSGQIEHLGEIPKSEGLENMNYRLAALMAYINMNKRLIFSEEPLQMYQDSLYKIWQDKNPNEFEDSKAYAQKVEEFMVEWMNKDNYLQTRTMPKFRVVTDDESRWQPTPPSYMDGLEPSWNKIRPFVLDSASQFKPVPPPKFSMDENSRFFKELKEVYDITNTMVEIGDESDKVQIAKFWDCNPYVSVNRGHFMFATKKITPGAHWILITKIACENSHADFDKTIYAHTKTAIGIADAFISCWDEKYRSNLVRPETLINKYFDDEWKPTLQTPPFPEYTSGHSVVSGAAATVLTDIFGDEFYFLDDSELRYGLPIRTYHSFNQAAQEAAISRMYGGIHYRAAVEEGIGQGKSVGKLVNDRLTFIN